MAGSASSQALALLRRARSLPLVNRGLRATVGARWWRHHLPSGLWRRLPVVGDILVEVPGGDSFGYRARGEPLGKTLFWRGVDEFEPGTAQVFRELAPQARLLLDVGAYSGYYTLLALSCSPALRSVCFEPMPAIRAWLQSHLELNSFEERVEIVAAAVNAGQTDSVSLFAASDPYSPSSSLHADYGTEQRFEHRVAATSLDGFVARRGLTDVDLIKIDTEGVEDQVLAGAVETLRSQRPFVICEVLEAQPEHLANIEALLQRADYRHAHILPGALRSRDRLVPDPARRMRNFLFWARDRALPPSLEAWLS